MFGKQEGMSPCSSSKLCVFTLTAFAKGANAFALIGFKRFLTSSGSSLPSSSLIRLNRTGILSRGSSTALANLLRLHLPKWHQQHVKPQNRDARGHRLVNWLSKPQEVIRWKVGCFLLHHYTILAKPVTAPVSRPVVNKVKIRGMRDSAWRSLGRWITQKDWTPNLNAPSCEVKFSLLMTELNQAIDTFLPEKVVKKHPSDRPWITNKIKISIRKRQSAFINQGKNSPAYWRNRVQCDIKMAKYHYYHHKVVEVEQTNPAKWWREIKKLTGQDVQQDWHHQFLSNNMDTKSLANKINDFLISLTDHFTPLSPGVPPVLVPHNLLVSENEVYSSLSSLQVPKAVGPDDIPNRLLKEFAPELAPIIRDIYNQSLKEVYIPTLLKSSIVAPIPKVTPPSTIEKDLRPISLTCTVAQLMEGFTCSRLLTQLDGKIDPRQYARKEHSTTDALLYMLQAIHEAVDSGEAGARMLFADFSKGFDLIDHTILMHELSKLEVHPALLSWIAAFLTNRQQAVRIGGTLSDWQTLKGCIPQGTKLGIILFTVMTNKLLSDWQLRIKFVDNTSAFEIIPQNSISLLNTVVFDAQDFT